VFINRSIPLSEQTREAWTEGGATLFKRSSTNERMAFLADLRGRDVLNFAATFDFDSPNARCWNPAPVVKLLTNPFKFQQRMNLGNTDERTYLVPQLLSDDDHMTDVWLKGPGRHGSGSSRCLLEQLGGYGPGEDPYAIQPHIEGTEYRAITVNNKVVQLSRRIGGNDAREYEWIGTRGAPRGIIPAAKHADRILLNATDADWRVVGWDLIKDADGRVWVLEGNSCPGVNIATAQRIRAAMLIIATEGTE